MKFLKINFFKDRIWVCLIIGFFFQYVHLVFFLLYLYWGFFKLGFLPHFHSAYNEVFFLGKISLRGHKRNEQCLKKCSTRQHERARSIPRPLSTHAQAHASVKDGGKFKARKKFENLWKSCFLAISFRDIKWVSFIKKKKVLWFGYQKQKHIHDFKDISRKWGNKKPRFLLICFMIFQML